MYIIKTTEKRPTLAVYEYIIDANNKKEAKLSLKEKRLKKAEKKKA